MNYGKNIQLFIKMNVSEKTSNNLKYQQKKKFIQVSYTQESIKILKFSQF